MFHFNSERGFSFCNRSRAFMQHSFRVSEQNEIGMNWVLINNFYSEKVLPLSKGQHVAQKIVEGG